MKNLVFRFYLTVTLCWQCVIAERSANGYFYDMPEGTLFDESPGTSQLLNNVAQFPPRQPIGGYYQQHTSSGPVPLIPVEIVPAKLVYEDSQTVNLNGDVKQHLESPPDFAQLQQIYGGSRGGNYQPIAFDLQDDSQVHSGARRPCDSEPIVAQFNPELVDLSNGGPLTRLITTCGPNNDCDSIRLQSDVNRHLAVLSAQAGGNYPNAHIDQLNTAQFRSYKIDIQADESPLVRPPGRRLIKYSEIEQEAN